MRYSILSKRQVLSLCNRVYYSLGMAAPYIIKLRVLMRETVLQQDRSESNKRELFYSLILQIFVLSLNKFVFNEKVYYFPSRILIFSEF